MQDQEQPKNPRNDKIGTAARIWRAIDKVAIRTPPRSPEREAEYRARQELRKVVDEAGEA